MESPAVAVHLLARPRLWLRFGYGFPLTSAIPTVIGRNVRPVLKAMRDWGLTWDKSTRVLA